MIIPARFNGPPNSANGGYACGLMAQELGGVAEVTLHRPPPLARQLEVDEGDGGLELRHEGTLIAQARPVELELEVTGPVSLEDAEEASERYAGFRHHAYPTCFTCGPAREDGLRIFAGPVAGRDLVASPWRPRGSIRPEIVWAALDCPSGWAVDEFQREGVLMGRMAARLVGEVATGMPYVVMGWGRGVEGRKRHAGSALFGPDGELVAYARSTWIASTR